MEMLSMKVLIDGLNQFYGSDVKLIKTLMKREYPEEYPELMKWKLQMLYFYEDGWIELSKIRPSGEFSQGLKPRPLGRIFDPKNSPVKARGVKTPALRQGLAPSGEFLLCRIDNYLHEGMEGSHIHLGERVIHVEMTIREAEKSIERIAARVLKEKYKKIWSDNDENPNC
jgi:hypothetical protein